MYCLRMGRLLASSKTRLCCIISISYLCISSIWRVNVFSIQQKLCRQLFGLKFEKQVLWIQVINAKKLDECWLTQSNTPLQFEGPLGLFADFEGRILAVISLGVFWVFFFFSQCHVFYCSSPRSPYVPFNVHVQLLSWHILKLVLASTNEEMLF